MPRRALHAVTPIVSGDAAIEVFGFSADLKSTATPRRLLRERNSHSRHARQLAHYDPLKDWEEVRTDIRLDHPRSGRLYILVSREAIAIPPDHSRNGPVASRDGRRIPRPLRRLL
jgi:dCTP deaminase